MGLMPGQARGSRRAADEACGAREHERSEEVKTQRDVFREADIIRKP